MNEQKEYWKNEQGQWCRICPKCQKIIVYSHQTNTCENYVKYAVKKKSTCLPCYNSTKLGKSFPKKKYVKPILTVGEITTFDYNDGKFKRTAVFQNIQYDCKNCGKTTIRKIPLIGEPFECRCIKCGNWQQITGSVIQIEK